MAKREGKRRSRGKALAIQIIEDGGTFDKRFREFIERSVEYRKRRRRELGEEATNYDTDIEELEDCLRIDAERKKVLV